MATVAEQLRQAREARELTIQQVAEITKIRTDHLRALEEGDFSVFSAPVYVRGFVRTYSALLKLDVPQTMAALDAELGATKNLSEPPSLSEHSGGFIDRLMLQASKVDWRKGRWVLAGVVVLAIVIFSYAAWHQRKHSDPLSGIQAPLYKPAQGVSGATLPLPTNAPPRR